MTDSTDDFHYSEVRWQLPEATQPTWQLPAARSRAMGGSPAARSRRWRPHVAARRAARRAWPRAAPAPRGTIGFHSTPRHPRPQDYTLAPLEDDCKLLGSMLDDCLRNEVGEELYSKASTPSARRRARLGVPRWRGESGLSSWRRKCAALSECSRREPRPAPIPQVEHIRALAQCAAQLSARKDEVRPPAARHRWSAPAPGPCVAPDRLPGPQRCRISCCESRAQAPICRAAVEQRRRRQHQHQQRRLQRLQHHGAPRAPAPTAAPAPAAAAVPQDASAYLYKKLAAELTGLELDEALPLTRALGHYLSLTSIAELHHRCAPARGWPAAARSGADAACQLQRWGLGTGLAPRAGTARRPRRPSAPTERAAAGCAARAPRRTTRAAAPRCLSGWWRRAWTQMSSSTRRPPRWATPAGAPGAAAGGPPSAARRRRQACQRCYQLAPARMAGWLAAARPAAGWPSAQVPAPLGPRPCAPGADSLPSCSLLAAGPPAECPGCPAPAP
jgi:hypothetical protein